ncbi:unnamed protein product [Closterium sp. Yama58-4]|nr:unnamed protein product [Closterium sp. Yama58-4]
MCPPGTKEMEGEIQDPETHEGEAAAVVEVEERAEGAAHEQVAVAEVDESLPGAMPGSFAAEETGEMARAAAVTPEVEWAAVETAAAAGGGSSAPSATAALAPPSAEGWAPVAETPQDKETTPPQPLGQVSHGMAGPAAVSSAVAAAELGERGVPGDGADAECGEMTAAGAAAASRGCGRGGGGSDTQGRADPGAGIASRGTPARFHAQPSPRRLGSGLAPGRPGPLLGWLLQGQQPPERMQPSSSANVQEEGGRGGQDEAVMETTANREAGQRASNEGDRLQANPPPNETAPTHSERNISKSAAWCAQQDDVEVELPHGLPVHPGGLKVLGSPIGNDGFCTDQVRTALVEVAEPLPLISQLNPQHALLMLSRSSRRISYLLRTTPVEALARTKWREWSESLVGAGLMASKLRIPLNELEQSLLWRQATLPARFGGLGIIDPISKAPAAYLASTAAAHLLLQQLNLPPEFLLHKAGELLSSTWTPPPPRVNPLSPLEARLPAPAAAVLRSYRENPKGTGNLQLGLSKAINHTRAEELLADTVTDRLGVDRGHAIRLISLKGVGAGDWLHAVPTRADLSISPGQFSMALGLRLGMELPVAEVCPCKRSNSRIADKSLPNHLLRCADGGDAVRTHNALVFAALRMAQEAGYKTFHETTAFSPPVMSKRADLAIRDQETGETWATDVTVTDPVLQRRDVRARKPPGWAAEEASQTKHRLYEARPGYVGFFGLAVETYGALAADTQQFLHMLAAYAARKKYRQGRLTTTAAHLNAHYRQRWSVMLQRSQAVSLLSKSNRAAEAASPQAVADPWAPWLGDL